MRDKGGTRDRHTRMTDTEEILHRARAGLWWFDGPLCCASHVQFLHTFDDMPATMYRYADAIRNKACMRLLWSRSGLICSRGELLRLCVCYCNEQGTVQYISGIAFVFMQGILAAILTNTTAWPTAVGLSACHPNPRCSAGPSGWLINSVGA